ncbi:ubiquitin carboxyl-terminal hydrolase, family 1 domain-containing protein [Sarocladium implicatum]|nr:ubiquitin carboxyl-terminal hydrolase, family 1 domain-containing protein [Sarocladium implicatum]
MPTEGVHVNEDGKKIFIPLENNPEVFTSLVNDLGASPELGFYDVFSVDDQDLLALIPRPVYALIFITPPAMYRDVRAADKTPLAKNGITYDGTSDNEPVLWFLQTIGNACGLYALIHSLANGEARPFVKPDSLLDKIFKEAKPLPVEPRARVLYDNDELEKIHMRAARTGDSVTPAAADFAELHFIAFTKGKDGHMWELEGATDGPVDRGQLSEDEDMLSERALKNGVKRFLEVANGNPNFSIVALAKKDDSDLSAERGTRTVPGE